MQKEILCGIYCIENIVNNKKYIGQSTNIYDRWSRHISELNKNKHYNIHLQKSWNKYGENNFSFYILELCDEKSLNSRECYYIEKYNSTNVDLGYNLTYGGQSVIVFTEEIIEKKSNSLKESYKNNPDLIEKRRQDALKQWANPEIKAKILGENNGMFGKKHSEESKRKMSETRKAKKRISDHRNTQPVLCIELNQVFDCSINAKRELGINENANILDVCRGKRQTAGGYHWKFLENDIS